MSGPPDAPLEDDPAQTRTQSPRGISGGTMGPYRLLERLGEGGMGDVWLAEQTRPVRRQVAFKVIKPGMDTAQVVARFEAERQALALMDHPAIAKVFDAGATDRAGRISSWSRCAGESHHRLLRPATAHDPRSGSSCSCTSVRRCSTRIRKASSTAI